MGGPSEALRVAACTREAALYACEHWHYSGSLPSGKAAFYGVWEDGQFVGVVVFSSGSGRTNWAGLPYGIEKTEVAELARVALTDHQTPVTQIVARAISLVRADSPRLRLLVSFADSAQGHLGRIYQAGNWHYMGLSKSMPVLRVNGEWRHWRSISSASSWARQNGVHEQYLEWFRGLPSREMPPKFKYLMPLDKQARRRVMVDALPYPTYDDLAEQVSEARRRTSGAEGSVQSRGSAR